MRLTDTHCHLNFEGFDADREAVIERAVKAGLERILIPAIDLETSRAAVALAEKYDLIYAAVGVQPNSGKSWEASTLKELQALAEHPKVVAIGEIGLDYYWDETPRYVQEQIFHYQLELAADLELPVIIHNREATGDVLRMLVRWQTALVEHRSSIAERPGVLHSFSGNAGDAQKAYEANFYTGITGPVTFKKALELQEVVQKAPLDRLLIETDAPYLTPHPFRGQRNEPGYVRYVAEKIGELKQLSLEEVAQATAVNAARLFEW
jgi:TatD DNase family protein